MWRGQRSSDRSTWLGERQWQQRRDARHTASSEIGGMNIGDEMKNIEA